MTKLKLYYFYKYCFAMASNYVKNTKKNTGTFKNVHLYEITQMDHYVHHANPVHFVQHTYHNLYHYRYIIYFETISKIIL